MADDIKVGVVCWIKAEPNPLSTSALLLSPGWIPKTVVGLVATANTPPPPVVTDFSSIQTGRNHRSLLFCRLKVDVDEELKNIAKVTSVTRIIDGGWTPPFKANKVDSFLISMAAKVKQSMKDPASYPGETSSICDIAIQRRHPNSALPATALAETVVANGLVKFRAGRHTDKLGVEEAGSPFHVPWVWSEFLLTYRGGSYRLTGIGSIFPTHCWYAQGKLVMTQAEVSDNSFPVDGLRTINTKALNLYPALSTGAPYPGDQAPESESPTGAVPRHLFTVSAGSPQSITFSP